MFKFKINLFKKRFSKHSVDKHSPEYIKDIFKDKKYYGFKLIRVDDYIDNKKYHYHFVVDMSKIDHILNKGTVFCCNTNGKGYYPICLLDGIKQILVSYRRDNSDYTKFNCPIEAKKSLDCVLETAIFIKPGTSNTKEFYLGK